MATSTPWNDLPEVALVKIYCLLPDIDKLNMACACKNWYRMFSSPVLWRERRVMFHHLNAERTSDKERKFIQKFGQYLRKLTLGFGTPTFKSCMLISKAADAYAKSVCSRNDIHLREIDIDHMHMEQHWHFILSRNRLVTALCKMLRKQKYLETVYLSGLRARVHDGCRILEAIVKNQKSRTITSLYMEDFFETNVFPWRQNRYVNAMSKFLALEHLHMNYKYVNAEVLRNMANKLSHSLQHLSLILEGDIRGVEIQSDVWYEFSERCPRVQLSMYLCTTLFRGNDLRPPFVLGMPVTEVYLTSWSRVDENEDRLAVLLRHLGRMYSSTLANFAMFFNRHDHLDRELLYMLERCSNIKDLCLQCRISADTVINVMKLHHQRKLALSSVNLTILGLSHDNWDRINRQKDRLLADVPDFVHVGPNEFGSSDSGSTVNDGQGDEDEEEVAEGEVFFNFGLDIHQMAVRVIDDDENDQYVPPANNGDLDDDHDGYFM